MGDFITENGVVLNADTQTANVKTIRKSTCEGCASKDSCQGGKECSVEAINSVGAKTGDIVVVGFESGSLIKVSLLLYIFPVFCMIVGAVMGSNFAADYGMNESDLAAILSFSFFFISFFCIRMVSGKMSGNQKYQAKIIKIKSRA